MKIPKRYIPDSLSETDKRKQKRAIERGRKDYREKKYTGRPHLASFKSRRSSHVSRAKRMYGVDKITPSRSLSRASGCSIQSMRRIVRKGEGAFYSSGSRPNQTAQSWAHARLASALTGGPSSAVDYHILEKGCSSSSKALRLAKKRKKSASRRKD